MPTDVFRSPQARERYLERYAMRARAFPVPSLERDIETSFGRTFVRESGPDTAPPLVMLPGIGSTGLSLGVTAKGLAGRFRTFVVDNIHDNGRSVETRPVTSASDFATWLDEVRAGLGYNTIHLLGLSYGGWIAAQFALRFPSRLGKVVLLAPAGTTAPIPWGFIWRALLCLIPLRFFMRQFVRWVTAEAHHTEEGRRFIDEMVDDGFLARRCFRPRRMVPPVPLTDEEWRGYQVPTLFLVGDREVNFPAEKAVAKLESLAPSVTPLLIPGAGHDFFFSRADQLNARIADFLAK